MRQFAERQAGEPEVPAQSPGRAKGMERSSWLSRCVGR